MIWVLVGILSCAELVVLGRIRVALVDGSVPLNPVGWIGYGEFADVTVDRRASPGTYWFVVSMVIGLAAVFGAFIFMVAKAGGG